MWLVTLFVANKCYSLAFVRRFTEKSSFAVQLKLIIVNKVYVRSYIYSYQSA